MAPTITFPSMPVTGRSIPIFRTPFPEDLTSRAPAIARRFGFRGRARDAGARLIFRDKEASLELFHASDSLRWSRSQTFAEEGHGRGRLPEEWQALELATDFLRSHEIALDYTEPRGVAYAELSRFSPRMREPITQRVAMQVNFMYRLDDVPVFGPGAKIQVTLGPRGEVFECYRFWREPLPEGERTLLSTDRVLGLLRRDPAFRDLKDDGARVEFHEAQLGYFALPPREYQGVLIPAWAFRGTVSTRELERYDFFRYVVAVDYAADEPKTAGVVFHSPGHLFS